MKFKTLIEWFDFLKDKKEEPKKEEPKEKKPCCGKKSKDSFGKEDNT